MALYVVMVLGLARGGAGLRLRPWSAALVFAAASRACGMAFELTLTVDGTGLGGIHPDTRASFILGQADCILIALATLALVRFWRLDFAGAYWIALDKKPDRRADIHLRADSDACLWRVRHGCAGAGVLCAGLRKLCRVALVTGRSGNAFPSRAARTMTAILGADPDRVRCGLRDPCDLGLCLGALCDRSL